MHFHFWLVHSLKQILTHWNELNISSLFASTTRLVMGTKEMPHVCFHHSYHWKSCNVKNFALLFKKLDCSKILLLNVWTVITRSGFQTDFLRREIAPVPAGKKREKWKILTKTKLDKREKESWILNRDEMFHPGNKLFHLRKHSLHNMFMTLHTRMRTHILQHLFVHG